ncbi:hypothetical protein BH23VER1_BH23VER1_06900 [soil metagenome]
MKIAKTIALGVTAAAAIALASCASHKQTPTYNAPSYPAPMTK